MKKWGALLLAMMMLMMCFGCQNEIDPSLGGPTESVPATGKPTEPGDPTQPATQPTIQPTEPEPTETIPAEIPIVYPCDRYDLDAYMLPYWDGYVMYQESAMVLENEDGTIPDIPLLYHAVEIVSVRSSDLQTLYEEGRDYTLVDGKLHIPEGSTIRSIEYTTYYPPEKTATSFPRNYEYGTGFIYFSEGLMLHSMQIAVTYKHHDRFQGEIPAYKGDQLPKTLEKLQNGEPLKIVLYGDSISTGVNSSGVLWSQPMAPAWYQMFMDKTKQVYPSANINFVNTAVGGMASNWGAENAGTRAADHMPDLCIIAFGMNDGTARFSPATFRKNIQTIMDTVTAKNPNCEFILIATMLPNAEVSNFMGCQKEYLPELEKMEKTGVVVADMTTFHEALLAKKRYCDMTGNNVNHPNDFLARAYAQVLFQTVAGQS